MRNSKIQGRNTVHGVVRELVGHDWQKMPKIPKMPNYGKRGRGKKFIEGNGRCYRAYDQYGNA